MGYRSLMEPNNIAVPNDQVFSEQETTREAYGLDNPDRFIYEEPKPPELIEQYANTWSQAKTEAN